MAGCLKNSVVSKYSELNLNQYSVGSPCRTICTVCGSPPCPDLNLIHYTCAVIGQIQAQMKGRLKTLSALSDGLLVIGLIRPF